jgi:hypothetical protein
VRRQGARSENILYGSLRDKQRRRSAKDPATLGAEFGRPAGSVVSQSQNPTVMLLRRSLPAGRPNSAHPSPFYEMGSKHREIKRIAELVAGETDRGQFGA